MLEDLIGGRESVIEVRGHLRPVTLQLQKIHTPCLRRIPVGGHL